MEVCMSLYKESESEAIYLFFDPLSDRYGIMRINKANPKLSEIIKMPDDGSVRLALARGGLVRLIKKALNGEYPQKLGYCPGW